MVSRLHSQTNSNLMISIINKLDHRHLLDQLFVQLEPQFWGQLFGQLLCGLQKKIFISNN